jgi:AraC-like DNA-binding protein
MDEGVLYAERNCAFQAHFHKNLEFIYPIGGDVEAIVGGERLIVKKNCLLIVDSMTVHHILGEATALWVCFPPSYLRDFFRFVGNRGFGKRVLFDSDGAIERVLRGFASVGNENELLAKARVNRFLGELVELVGLDERKSDYSSVVERAISFVNEHYESELSLSVIATEIGYNRYTLSHRFKRETGMELREYLSAVRLNEFVSRVISERLIGEASSLARAALDVGFGSLQTFYRAFKARYGVSPERFFQRKS